MSRTPHLYAAVFMFLFNEKNEILLLRRANTGYYDGGWTVPAGHVENGETPIQAIIHECKEEINLDVIPRQSDCFAVLHRIGNERQYVDYGFYIDQRTGELINGEPEKCSEIGWFALDQLPEVLTPTTQRFIHMYQNKAFYAEYQEK